MVDVADSGLILRAETYLFPDEIESIRLELVSDESFTASCKQMEGEYKLKEALSAAVHYIGFRGFRVYGVKELQIPDKRWKQDVMAILNRIRVPDSNTNLFKTTSGATNSTHFSGFAIDSSGEEPILYEFSNRRISEDLRRPIFGIDVIIATKAIIQHKRRPQANIQTYAGNDIIERLAEIPVENKYER